MARMPSHLSVASQRRVGNTVQVTLMADLKPFLEACRRFNQAVGQAMAKVGKALEDARRAHRGQFALVPSPSAVGRLAWAQKREVYVAGLEGRYFVRGGLDSRYLEPEARDALVRELMAGRELPCLVSARERALVATAFLAGWVQGQGKDWRAVCPGRCQYAVDVGAPDWASCADGVDRCSWYVRT